MIDYIYIWQAYIKERNCRNKIYVSLVHTRACDFRLYDKYTVPVSGLKTFESLLFDRNVLQLFHNLRSRIPVKQQALEKYQNISNKQNICRDCVNGWRIDAHQTNESRANVIVSQVDCAPSRIWLYCTMLTYTWVVYVSVISMLVSLHLYNMI